uniref:Sporulation integral membrane protein YlbJ n=1 Tax=Virgibacillus oceani TaxID=1479511 RepID=A0A917M141_9BACI|nr:sporulation integral membrane protein YlbJ [Virgibacillus oceani]GGG69914.1 sporulation integral membrane protein YlbJ [Virgibacillus oceani]
MKQIIKTLLLASITCFIAFAILKFPMDATEASIRGLTLWWEKVFPTLLPFFVIAELLLGFGVVKFIGILCEPIMRPIFNVPGVGSFAWVMGMASGYPTGAKISARLREENQITQIEGERLVSFTNASSPLFIFGVISVGFFVDEKLGILLAVCHYLGNALVGICMRFHGRTHEQNTQHSTKQKISIMKALQEMHRTRLNDPRPIGQVLGEAVLNAVKTLVMVGGFIIIFSVITKLLFLIGVTPFLAKGFQSFFHLLSLPIDLALPFLSGLFEITIGGSMISHEATDNLLAQLVVVSFILAFHGFSVQAQVASIIANTDIRFTPYFFARFLHGLFASLLTIILFKPLYLNRQVFDMEEVPVSKGFQQSIWTDFIRVLEQIGPLITFFALGVAIIVLYRRKQHK